MGTIPNSHNGACAILVTKPEIDSIRRPWTRVPHGHRCRIINKTLADWIQQYGKKTTPWPNGGLSQKCKAVFVLKISKCNSPLKKVNRIIITIDIHKVFDKIQHWFMIKTVSKLGVEEKPLLLLGGIHTNLSVSIPLSGERLGAVPLRSGANEGCPLSIQNLIQHHTQSPSQGIKARRQNKRHTDWKGRNRAVLACR